MYTLTSLLRAHKESLFRIRECNSSNMVFFFGSGSVQGGNQHGVFHFYDKRNILNSSGMNVGQLSLWDVGSKSQICPTSTSWFSS